MVSNPIQYDSNGSGAVEYVFFAGDKVSLAGQIDYPHAPIPMNGYPLLFVIQHATCTSRSGYAHYLHLVQNNAMALFRWDKRGTGKSAAGADGSIVQDTLNAYQEAIKRKDIDARKVVILAHNEGTLLLGEAWEQFAALQAPAGVVLVGNMLDERKITAIKSPAHVVVSKNDWNAWQTYAEGAAKVHAAKYNFAPSFYVAPNTNRRLQYDNTSTFHNGALDSMSQWISRLWQS